MARLVYFSSGSGNTARLVARLGLDALRIPIDATAPLPQPQTPYVLICPTYSDGTGRGAVPRQVIRFLNDPDLCGGLRGVIGAGNRNFGRFYAHAATVIAQKCAVPCLYRFELAGTDTDIAHIRAGLHNFWRDQCLTVP
ncbi:class Ib ribonucleoside-diphosphate reductase assembly flavoprotein NrdI [Gemmobacter fulvus]|uniref:Protein NrdI n=1 Tax=Gemmobacter fulvus TaxID=2840474 RepID=A0A975RZI7_9RHOB|nr:class Ib ribonucleoside-diphosphate reductase assembly flavoprotein NrdI [Gemmobacter fulvus]MBT9246782.1 class Ib ribonucleoside-diphosphate reductase assembly flavoprotein NrdI [Gemmobacter fulvus]QWK89119.1 class Ib ribonucleoside-diphosphate reductase assembly flavoprotein NrdI [Gemmobacter fulvus]